MPRLARLIVMALGLPVLVGACGDSAPASGRTSAGIARSEPVRARAYEGSAAGLQRLFGDLLSAIDAADRERARNLARSLALDDAESWFRDVFGDELGAALAAEYAPGAQRLEELVDLLTALRASGHSRVTVEQFDRAGDPAAVEYQSAALERMKRPTPLYSVRLGTAAGDEVFHLWSFAYQAGFFRWIGKTKRVMPEPEGEGADLREYRRRDMARARQLVR